MKPNKTVKLTADARKFIAALSDFEFYAAHLSRERLDRFIRIAQEPDKLFCGQRTKNILFIIPSKRLKNCLSAMRAIIRKDFPVEYPK